MKPEGTELYADELPYWKTSTSDPGTWIDRAAIEIERAGGEVIGRACGKLPSGRVAFVLQFKLEEDVFRVVWPVLTPRHEKDLAAARRQAATALFYDVKARCISSRFMGARAAFCAFMLLPDGRSVGDLALNQLAELPEILGAHKALPQGDET
jgi:hypothetical protein